MLSLTEAANKYKLSASHLRLLCRTGVVPAVKIGRDWMIADEQVTLAAINARPQRGKYIRKKKKKSKQIA